MAIGKRKGLSFEEKRDRLLKIYYRLREPLNLKEIEKLGEVIIEKTSVGLKAATQAVIGDVPKMIADLTKEIESGPVDNFAIAIRKLIKLVDDLGINLRDYNDKLADTVSEFTGTQAKLEEKLAELNNIDSDGL